MSQFFPSGGQNIGASASASVLPMNIQDWFPLGLTRLISLQSKRLSRVFSNITVQKHQFSVLSFLNGPILTSILDYWKKPQLFIIFIFLFIFFISWRLITLQYCSGFCHTLTWISHGFTCIPHPDPPSHLPLHPIPLGLPSAPGPSTCLMHPTWAGDLFHPR